MTEKQYARLVKELSPASPIKRDCINAFWIGGTICVIGQLLQNGYMRLGAEREQASSWASITLVALSALLTGFSLYDDIARYAGAGTLVPITGFANAITASAVEFKTEMMPGSAANKMFIIAGPVIVYGLAASVVYGFIYWLAIVI